MEEIENNLKHELKQMSFEDVQKLQNKFGLKKFKTVLKEKEENDEDSNEMTSVSGQKKFTRMNKNRPQELSSKRPVSTFRNIFQVKKREIIDPRFNSAYGEYKPELFRKSYGFINDIRKREIETLTEQLKIESELEKKVQIKSALIRLKQQTKSHEESEKKEKMKVEFKKKAKDDAQEGKRPHFLNKSEEKVLELAEKYKELKKSGKIDKYLAKKRKKQLSKDSKHLNKHVHLT